MGRFYVRAAVRLRAQMMDMLCAFSTSQDKMISFADFEQMIMATKLARRTLVVPPSLQIMMVFINTL